MRPNSTRLTRAGTVSETDGAFFEGTKFGEAGGTMGTLYCLTKLW